MIGIIELFAANIYQLKNKRKKWKGNKQHIGKVVKKVIQKTFEGFVGAVTILYIDPDRFFHQTADEPAIPLAGRECFFNGIILPDTPVFPFRSKCYKVSCQS